jgi:hypothetical protein
MECPKCNGQAYLADETFAQVAEHVSPPKLILNATFVCKACSNKFSRVVVDILDSKTEGNVYKSAGGINKILSDLNFPEESTKVDTDTLERLSTFDTGKKTEEYNRSSERPRFTDL